MLRLHTLIVGGAYKLLNEDTRDLYTWYGSCGYTSRRVQKATLEKFKASERVNKHHIVKFLATVYNKRADRISWDI
jgi:hypothetical protein